MLLAVEAWRLGGTLLGDAVDCEQRTSLLATTAAHRTGPQLSPRCPSSRGDKGDVQTRSPARGGSSSRVPRTSRRVAAAAPLLSCAPFGTAADLRHRAFPLQVATGRISQTDRLDHSNQPAALHRVSHAVAQFHGASAPIYASILN